MNIVIAGPCGVGKSTIAQLLAQKAGMVFLDFDDLRAVEMGRNDEGYSPCSVSKLNLKECLPSILDTCSTGFVLDIGGDTVFRLNANNDDRRDQVLWLRKTYSAQVVVLTAERENLFQRFTASKNRYTNEFETLWTDWKSTGEPYWRSCADQVVDTTHQSVGDTLRQIEGNQKC
jgi:shikimate kinase